mmetsp:Transcript_8820/g.15843  ORF Transcript_8820/g.15843 Transcript_8820/m.15843 type:complete len:103 (-) Transcript_8820:50-358(-)
MESHTWCAKCRYDSSNPLQARNFAHLRCLTRLATPHRAAVSTCVLCHQPVRGMYVVCPGCGHGGHLKHLQQWFSKGQDVCPSGCGHRCDWKSFLGMNGLGST